MRLLLHRKNVCREQNIPSDRKLGRTSHLDTAIRVIRISSMQNCFAYEQDCPREKILSPMYYN